jgi:hypothetical protein
VDIKIEFIPKKKMRYDTLDDYQYKKGVLTFQIADTGNKVYNMLLLFHSMIEQFTAECKDITSEDVDDFDFAHDKYRGEIGDLPNCPYRDQHGLAMALERILCSYLGIPWKTFDDYVSRLT